MAGKEGSRLPSAPIQEKRKKGHHGADRAGRKKKKNSTYLLPAIKGRCWISMEGKGEVVHLRLFRGGAGREKPEGRRWAGEGKRGRKEVLESSAMQGRPLSPSLLSRERGEEDTLPLSFCVLLLGAGKRCFLFLHHCTKRSKAVDPLYMRQFWKEKEIKKKKGEKGAFLFPYAVRAK